MATSTTTSLLAFPILCSIISILLTQQATAQSTICVDDKGNFTLNTTYHNNLNYLLSTLATPQNNNNYGFYNLSYGNSSNQVYAIALCRGDTTPGICRSCLRDSTSVLPKRCPNRKEALLWYDFCMLRYANRPLFGLMETRPNVVYHNTENVPSDIVEEYFRVIRRLLDDLKRSAGGGGDGGSLRKFAAANATAPRFRTIYGLVECTPDLSKEDCDYCLEDAFGYIPGCCDGKIGGQLLGPSCKFRYEEYLFYNSTAHAHNI